MECIRECKKGGKVDYLRQAIESAILEYRGSSGLRRWASEQSNVNLLVIQRVVEAELAWRERGRQERTN